VQLNSDQQHANVAHEFKSGLKATMWISNICCEL
jgi:hypothetical protein